MAVITISAVAYADDPMLWDELLYNDPLQYLLGFPLDQEYSRLYAPQINFRDLSLIATASGQPVAGLQITRHTENGADKISFFGRPALLRTHRGASAENVDKAQKLLAEEFCKIQAAAATPFTYLDMCMHGSISEFATSLLKGGYIGTPVYKQTIDLSLSDDELRRGIRKSYRSLISWGEKNLALDVYDAANTTAETIEDFHQLHIRVTGKETRPAETWALQHRQIIENQAFMITARLDNALVSAAIFSHTPLYCFYGASASIREMFDKPLSHAILWRSILEAKRRGCRLYEMGDLYDLYPSGYSEKEKNIAVFKRGFGGTARIQMKITQADC